MTIVSDSTSLKCYLSNIYYLSKSLQVCVCLCTYCMLTRARVTVNIQVFIFVFMFGTAKPLLISEITLVG